MKAIVDKYKIGISLSTEGKDIEEIKSSISNMLMNYENFYNNLQKIKDYFLWENQHKVFTEIFDLLLGENGNN